MITSNLTKEQIVKASKTIQEVEKLQGLLDEEMNNNNSTKLICKRSGSPYGPSLLLEITNQEYVNILHNRILDEKEKLEKMGVII